MRYLIFLCVLYFLSNPLVAQTKLVAELANQVCRCMETIDRVAPPAEQARTCVRLVGQRNKQVLRGNFGLDPEKEYELSQFSELVADLLSTDCPVLSTLRLDDGERELRWSDANKTPRPVQEGLRYTFPKNPPADAPEKTVAEPPLVWRLSGSIVGRAGRGALRLRLPAGEVQFFEFPAAISRRTDLVAGQLVTVMYKRQWTKTKSGGIVALVVVAIEE